MLTYSKILYVAAPVRTISRLLAMLLMCVCAGCGGGPIALMPTPNLYSSNQMNPFVEVPPPLQATTIDALYFTDRVPAVNPPDAPADLLNYGTERSRSVAFGISRIQFGPENLTWDDLVKISTHRERASGDIKLTVAKTSELARFPNTPRSLIPPQATQPASSPAAASTEPVWHPAYIGDEIPNAESIAAQEAFRKSMAEHMAASPVKEVYLFVHGYNNTFSDSVITVAQMWHFLGRAGVPVAYSWPAGASGLLRGYTRDSESSEFTVFHLKQCLRLIASCPEVEKINILAHSRGTAVTTSALRELHLEIAGSGRSTREVLKLGTLVLAAPDLDVDTVIQRMMTVRLGRVPERFALYINKSDQALSMSNWLFGGITRLGALDSKMFTAEELAYARNEKSVQIIEARVSDTGAFGHDYFHSNPAVSSDIILLMRYAYPPGADSGRPLRLNPNGFWYIDDEYPGPPKTSMLEAVTKSKAP